MKVVVKVTQPNIACNKDITAISVVEYIHLAVFVLYSI